jgi:benzoyl-CoA-dihydrodiol lyase
VSIDFLTDPSRYRHWRLQVEGDIAQLILDVDEDAGLFDGYQLKLNSYDLGVDIELNDAIARLRFEHPEVKVVVLRSGKDRVFCAGANIRMLAATDHAHKVNFCKFTNETRNAMEDASAHSGQVYLCAIRGACAGGGYELAMAADHIILADDGSSSVSLPEVPLLAVLPGTGGLTRLTDKRLVRRDRADVFCTTEEGVKGQRAADWRLVDQAVPLSNFDAAVADTAAALAARSDRPSDARGVSLGPLARSVGEDSLSYSCVQVTLEREAGVARVCLHGPDAPPPTDTDGLLRLGDAFWPLRLARELDDALLHLRLNETEVGLLAFTCAGEPSEVLAHDAFLLANREHWLVREVLLLWKRVMKRLDLTSRSLVALIEPGSCFAGLLAEVALACDRSYMLVGQFEGDNRAPASLCLTPSNFGCFPMSNDLSRLQTRFLDDAEALERASAAQGQSLDAEASEALGLVTFAYDDIDWEDEVRVFMEERASFSPDAMVGLEANLRFAGPETMETRIFARLTAWQNWIFQRPGATGEAGALKRYGTGTRPEFSRQRV